MPELNIVILLRCPGEEMPDNNEHFQRFLNDAREDIIKSHEGSRLNIFVPDTFKNPKSEDCKYFRDFAEKSIINDRYDSRSSTTISTTFLPQIYDVEDGWLKKENTVRGYMGTAFKYAKKAIEKIDEVVILSVNRDEIKKLEIKNTIKIFSNYYKFPKEKIIVYQYIT